MSSISSVSGRADVLTQMLEKTSPSSFFSSAGGLTESSQLKLAWKRPKQALATTVVSACSIMPMLLLFFLAQISTGFC